MSAGYSMTLEQGGRALSVPVLPGKLRIESPGRNERVDTLGLGEVALPGRRGLQTVAWEGLFPKAAVPHAAGRGTEPAAAVRWIQAARDTGKPVRLTVTGSDLDLCEWMLIEDFGYEERAGEPGDLYYEIKLTEWRNTTPVRVDLPPPDAPDQPAEMREPERPGEPAPVNTYTVVAGNSLWGIAQKVYGNGARYPEIYAANQTVIDGRNRKTGASKYTIYPGQVFLIP